MLSIWSPSPGNFEEILVTEWIRVPTLNPLMNCFFKEKKITLDYAWKVAGDLDVCRKEVKQCW